MRAVDQLLGEYSESHRNPTNKTIHWICVPLILFSTLGLLWWVHPYAALGLVAFSTVWYLRLSVPLALGMLLISSFVLAGLWYTPRDALLWVSAGVWIVAWITQFVGHEIEGKKPSFFRDIFFLLIGPLWILSALYRRWNLAY
ncbi:MAG: Mpo1-like protein [Pseudomonadota bacterium]|nr:Mpo1-like protein [Pseudomonadota bacterium]